MSFPIHVRYDGENEPVPLPLFPDTSRARTWWQALAYVNKVIAPSGSSFILGDGQYAIRYEEGRPHQGDLRALLAVLRHGLDPRPATTLRQAA